MLMIGSISTLSFAKSIDVPQNVQTAFSNKYPNVKLKNWRMENGQYVASFVTNKRNCEATYSCTGNWVSTLTTYRHVYKHLTPAIRNQIKNSRYASYHLDEAKSLQTPYRTMLLVALDNNSGNSAAYENAGSVDDEMLYFNNNGKLIRSVSNN